MRFDIKNRFTGSVIFTAEIDDCAADAPDGIKLGLAVLVAVKARAYLTRADLAGAYLARADLAGADLARADLAGANLAGANLARANLARANLARAYLAGAYLARANLARANLACAYLARADLAGANLARANLARAYLAGADLACGYLAGADLADQWIIQGATRSDGYAFFLQKLKDDNEPMIKAGCRYFTISEAQAHWETTRKGQNLLDETKIIVRSMIDLARVRGLMP